MFSYYLEFLFSIFRLTLMFSFIIYQTWAHVKQTKWLSGKESTLQCRRHKSLEFSLWVGKNPKLEHPLQYPYLEDPWTEEPGKLQSKISQKVIHYWRTEHTNTHINEIKWLKHSKNIFLFRVWYYWITLSLRVTNVSFYMYHHSLCHQSIYKVEYSCLKWVFHHFLWHVLSNW